MLKFVAGRNGLENLRYAKDEAGYLKRVRTPGGEAGAESYMTVKWDQLVPFPSSMFCGISSPPLSFPSLQLLPLFLRCWVAYPRN